MFTKAEWLRIQYKIFPATEYRGVFINAEAGEERFIAFFGQPGKRFLVGFFSDATAAARAYDSKLAWQLGRSAITNTSLGRLSDRGRAASESCVAASDT